jgi:hypothetical protein
MMLSKKICFYIILSLFPLYVFSQAITAEKKISICQGYLSPQAALDLIEKQENVTFSYNPQNFKLPAEIYLCKKNTSLRTVIEIIMGQGVDLIIEKRHIIIKPAKVKEVETLIKKPRIIKLNGTIENSINGLPVDSAKIQVYNECFYSNSSGYFSFKISTDSDSILMFVERSGYTGSISTTSSSDQSVRIFMQPETGYDYTYMPSGIKEKNPEIENHWLAEIVVSDNQVNLTKNRKNLVDKQYQVSVIPNVGTYFNESGMCRFKQSYNVFAGYVGEVDGLEVGLGVNIIRYDLTGVQVSGVANIVGGEVSGWQLSTGANVVVGNFKGAQTASVANTTWGNFNGIQASTGVNLVKSKLRGFQIAPVNLVVDTLLGTQIGVVNICAKPVVGTQFSALVNFAPQVNSLQYSTFLNITGENNAPQIGVMNVSKNQKNLQLGLFNFADTISGISIGFLSFVKKGFTHLDYSLNLDAFSSIKFKTGTWKFYNIISTSFRPDNEPDFAIGYGFGSHFDIWKMFGINYDITASQIFENNTFFLNNNTLAQLNLNLNFRIAKHFSLYAGGQLNALFTTNLANDAIHFESSIPPTNTFFDKQYPNMRCYMWPSVVIGVRI